MKLYRVFAGLHYQGSMFAPFFETQWTPKKAEAKKAFDKVMLNDFKQSETDINLLETARVDQLPVTVEKPSPETCFLWIELAEVNLDRKALDPLWGETEYPPNDLVLELADYDQKELAERGLYLNGRKMKPETLKAILQA